MEKTGINIDDCNIFITYDKPYFSPGDQVSGRINLNVTDTYEASSLKLRIKGVEKIEYSLNTLQSTEALRSEYLNNKCVKMNPFPKIEALLYRFKDSRIFPGQYAFPFKFFLESHLPPSFKYEDEKCKAQIYYITKAILESHQNTVVKKKNLQVTKHLLFGYQNLNTLGKTQISSCCNDEGFYSVNFTNLKQFYSLNEDEKIKISMDFTNCPNDALVITVSLLQNLSFHLPDSHKLLKSRIYRRDLSRYQIEAGSKIDLEFSLSDKSQASLENKFIPSFKSGLFECEHKLVVITDFLGTCQTIKQIKPNNVLINFYKIMEEDKKNEKNENPEVWNPTVENLNNILYIVKKPQMQNTILINEPINKIKNENNFNLKEEEEDKKEPILLSDNSGLLSQSQTEISRSKIIQEELNLQKEKGKNIFNEEVKNYRILEEAQRNIIEFDKLRKNDPSAEYEKIKNSEFPQNFDNTYSNENLINSREKHNNINPQVKNNVVIPGKIGESENLFKNFPEGFKYIPEESSKTEIKTSELDEQINLLNKEINSNIDTIIIEDKIKETKEINILPLISEYDFKQNEERKDKIDVIEETMKQDLSQKSIKNQEEEIKENQILNPDIKIKAQNIQEDNKDEKVNLAEASQIFNHEQKSVIEENKKEEGKIGNESQVKKDVEDINNAIENHFESTEKVQEIKENNILIEEKKDFLSEENKIVTLNDNNPIDYEKVEKKVNVNLIKDKNNFEKIPKISKIQDENNNEIKQNDEIKDNSNIEPQVNQQNEPLGKIEVIGNDLLDPENK